MITQKSLWDRVLFTHFFFLCVKGTTVTMPTSRVHRILARSFYSYSPGYVRIPVNETEISVGRIAFGGTYARIIQRAYRRYRKKSPLLPLAHLLTKCTWNAIRYYDNKEELRDFVGLFLQLDEKRR